MILLSAIWGSAFIAIKISLNSFNPLSIASLRLIIASLFLLFFFFLKKYSFNLSKENIFYLFLIGIIGNFLPFFLISWAEQFIQSSTAGILMAVGPIMTLVLSHFLTRDDRFTYLKLVSVLIGLIGVLFIFDFNFFSEYEYGSRLEIISKLLVVFAAFGYMISNILAYNKLEKIDSFIITTFATCFGAIFSLPFFIYSELINTSSINLTSTISIIYLGLFPTAIAFQFRYYITKVSGPVFLSNVAYLIPAFAVFWGYIFLSEKITQNSLIGICLVLLGVYISQKKLMQKIT